MGVAPNTTSFDYNIYRCIYNETSRVDNQSIENLFAT